MASNVTPTGSSSVTQQILIQLEGFKFFLRYTPTSLPPAPYLADLAAALCRDMEEFRGIKPYELSFFVGDNRDNEVDNSLLEDVIRNIGGLPLVIRYPLSSARG